MCTMASPAPTASPVPLPTTTATKSHKSYRRKYRKAIIKFELEMRKSNSLFRDQQRLVDISQRLAEENDQMLSLLLEMNSHPQVPARLRYDLREPSAVEQPTKHIDIDEAAVALRSARHKVFKGELLQADYEQFEQSLLDTVEFAPRRSYAALLKSNPLESNPVGNPDLSGSLAGGLLSAKQEEQYLHSLDLYCTRQVAIPRSHALSNLGTRQSMTQDKQNEREREYQLKNPVSVYNWLRKNQPQVFLQDPDEKQKAAASSRKSKRESLAKKNDLELYDEEGVPIEVNGSKNKRKRDDDGGYRPKGGNPRPTKRRKDETGRTSKRASMDVSTT